MQREDTEPTSLPNLNPQIQQTLDSFAKFFAGYVEHEHESHRERGANLHLGPHPNVVVERLSKKRRVMWEYNSRIFNVSRESSVGMGQTLLPLAIPHHDCIRFVDRLLIKIYVTGTVQKLLTTHESCCPVMPNTVERMRTAVVARLVSLVDVPQWRIELAFDALEQLNGACVRLRAIVPTTDEELYAVYNVRMHDIMSLTQHLAKFDRRMGDSRRTNARPLFKMELELEIYKILRSFWPTVRRLFSVRNRDSLVLDSRSTKKKRHSSRRKASKAVNRKTCFS